jgi:flagellar basal body rod protein FlgG
MTTILSAAASGLQHYSRMLDVVGNNIANINTEGFKRVRALGEGTPALQEPGSGRLGVAQTTLDRLFDTAAARATEAPLHFAIPDDAFFPVRDLDGSVVYARLGSLEVDAAGNVSGFGGRLVEPAITVPAGSIQPAISHDGTITAISADGEVQELGRLVLVRFPNPAGLESLGDGVFRESLNSGTATGGYPGEDGFATLITGSLEASNVELSVEFTTMIIAQRAYQASAHVYRAGDEMLAIATDLTA